MKMTTTQIKQLKKAKAAKPVTSANVLTQQVLKVLGLKGWHVWRNNTVGVWDATKKVYRANSATKGISDVIGFRKNGTAQMIAIEVKAGRDKLSPEQEAFLKAINEAGGIGVVIRNSDDIEKLIKEL